MKHWLVKSEADDYPIERLKKDKKTLWTGVRNYQARNYLREMRVGDLVLYYHSNAEPSGIVGVAKVQKTAEADPTQFDKKSDYYDPKATSESPRWFCPTLTFVSHFPFIPLERLRSEKKLQGMAILQKGTRLSVTPVTESEFECVLRLSEKGE